MARIYQYRDPELSLLQSAIDNAAVMQKAGGGAQSIGEAIASTDRPGVENSMVFQAAALSSDLAHMRAAGQTTLHPGAAPLTSGAQGVGEGAKYCASLAYNYAKGKATGNEAAATQAWADLTAKFGSCDARYANAAIEAAKYFSLAQASIPYVMWHTIEDFVVDDGTSLPENATVAIIGDWGTGQPEALAVLESLAAKKPSVVIHLGDVYYAGTEPEQQHYFFDNWCNILKLSLDPNRNVTSTTPRTFSLAGNHDMYSGGQPFYTMIRQLGQTASFFCLRNQYWQFIGLDTGYYDHGLVGPCTHLAPGEPEWLADKMKSSNGRKTVLLSHHQLFSNMEYFDPKNGQAGGSTNPLLLAEVKDILPQVALWLWGHQHQFVAYADPRVKARCMGHGAYPVGLSELGKPDNAIPIDPNIPPQDHGSDFWDNGYAILQLDKGDATVTWYAVDDTGTERSTTSTEKI